MITSLPPRATASFVVDPQTGTHVDEVWSVVEPYLLRWEFQGILVLQYRTRNAGGFELLMIDESHWDHLSEFFRSQIDDYRGRLVRFHLLSIEWRPTERPEEIVPEIEKSPPEIEANPTSRFERDDLV